jgi:hypothetical protein
MILTYYQAVDLMTFLPVLLSPADTKTSQDTVTPNNNTQQDATDDDRAVYEMWRYTSPGIEVNGADFY